MDADAVDRLPLPCEVSLIATPEYAIYTYEYYSVGHANAGLQSAYIDPLGNRTDYQYDGHHRLVKVIEPADVAGGPRAETVFVYDVAGRMQSTTDAEGHETTYLYDARNRVTQVGYADASTERFFYGSGDSSNLLVKQSDRRGIVTRHEYDSTGRRLRSVTATSVMDFAGNETSLNDPLLAIEETLTYVDGTNLVATRTRAGETTEYAYDHRQRVVETRVKPNTGTTLASKQTYTDNQLTATEDPYGRKTFYAYDATDSRLIRSVQAASSSATAFDRDSLLALTRSAAGTPNPAFLITDYLYDADGQTTSVIDPLGVVTNVEYDRRGRTIRTAKTTGGAGQEAAATGTVAGAAQTETIYDAGDNVVEVRLPAFFDSADTHGFNQAKAVLAYTGRGAVKSVSVAPGTAAAATETYDYNLGGKRVSRTDAKGSLWQTLDSTCCGRVRKIVKPDGHGSLISSDPMGNVYHVALVKDVLSHENTSDPLDAKTFGELTTRFDGRDRPVARTVWLSPRGAVQFDTPPIAGDNGVPATDGLTTRWRYDDNLTDGVGLDQEFAASLAGLNLGAGCDGSAVLVTNPAGERSLSIHDGLGRTVRSVLLSATGTALVQTTSQFDEIVSVAGAGNVLQVSVTNGLGHTARGRLDGLGRLLQMLDAEDHVTSFEYDAYGNRMKTRDPNNVGVDQSFDALGRLISATDTHGDAFSQQYDRSGRVVQRVDAKQKTSTSAYDAQGRLIATTDRLEGTTSLALDAVGNLLSLTDAENQTTSYVYDSSNRRVSETYPDSGQRLFAYDELGRLKSVQDQSSAVISQVYDFAGRRTRREYRAAGVEPTGPPTDFDEFTFDAASRLLTATKGRYSNTVTLTYDDGGRLASESLTAFGQTYTVSAGVPNNAGQNGSGQNNSSGYDAAGRRVSQTYPDGTLLERTLTARGQLASLSYNGQSLETRAYDPGRRLVTQTAVLAAGSNLVTSRSYRDDGLLAAISRPNVPGTSFTYDWDANKNKTSEVVSDLMANYGFTVPGSGQGGGSGGSGQSGYDANDRLIAWNRADGNKSQSWSLTAVGDWTQFTETAAGTGLGSSPTSETRTYGPTHTLTAINSTPVLSDTRGNLTQPGDGRTFAYDLDRMLSSVTVTASAPGIEGTHTYTFDALGRRVSKIVAPTGGTSSTLVFIHSGHQIVAEYSPSQVATNPLRKYAFGSYIDEPVALIDHTGAGSGTGTGANNGTTTVYHYHVSHLYSVAALTDQSGQVVERYAYDAYGQQLILDGAAATVRQTSLYQNRFTYTAREWDPESATYHYRHRTYDPRLARFLQRDPIGYRGGLNLSAYVGGRSLGSVDPLGLSDWMIPTGENPGASLGQAISDSTPWLLDNFFTWETAWRSCSQAAVNGANAQIRSIDELAEPKNILQMVPGPLTLIGPLLPEVVPNLPQIETEFVREDPTARTIGGNSMAFGASILLPIGASKLKPPSGFFPLTKPCPCSTSSPPPPKVDIPIEKRCRALSVDDLDEFMKTGKVPPTGETMTAESIDYSSKYRGVLIEFDLAPGTTSKLAEVGVADTSASVARKYPEMPRLPPNYGWPEQGAYFKAEGGQISIGLGKGPALDIFNSGIIDYRIVPRTCKPK